MPRVVFAKAWLRAYWAEAPRCAFVLVICEVISSCAVFSTKHTSAYLLSGMTGVFCSTYVFGRNVHRRVSQ